MGAAGSNELGGHAHELAHVGDGAGGDHIRLAFAAQFLSARLVDCHVVQAQAFNDVFEPLDAAHHGLGQVNVQVGAACGDDDAGQAGTGADVQDFLSFTTGHEVEDGRGVDDVARPDALHVAGAQQAAQLAFLLEHARVFGDVGEGVAEEVADRLGGLFWDEGVAHLATPSHPVRVLTHRLIPRGG